MMRNAPSDATPRSVRLATVLSVAAYLVLGLSVGSRVGISGDAIALWATAEPLRTVLCVERAAGPTFQVAASPTREDRATVAAELQSLERRVDLGPVGLVIRDHAYRASLQVGPFEVPWMKNDYTGAWAEWPAHLAWRITGHPEAGRLIHLLLGALVLLAAALLAGRLAGWPAAAVCGLFLATDPWFHLYKEHLGGQEVMLQLLTVACASLLGAALIHGSRRRLLAAALAVGLALHTKPSFAAIAAVLFVVALTLLPWRRLVARGRRLRALGLAALLLLALAVGAAPTWGFWLAADAVGVDRSAGAQESARGRLDILLQRHLPSLASGDEVQRSRGRGGWRSDPKKTTGPIDLLLEPRRPWRQGYAARARHGNQPPHEGGPEWHMSTLEDVGRLGAAGLGLAGLLGALALGVTEVGRRRRREPPGRPVVALGLVATALLVPPALSLLHPDAHHLALWLPLAAPALGVAVGALIASRAVAGLRTAALVLVGASLLLFAAGRVGSLVRAERDVVEQTGRLTDARAQARLARELLRLGALAPAVLEYDLMALMEAWTGGQVRPWLYARSARGAGRMQCLPSSDPSWLERIVEAHAGGHLVVAWGVVGNPGGAHPTSWVSPEQVQAAGRARGLEVRSVSELIDGSGRWYATIWAIGDR
jgi:4-amino-4-deoxy-L-arabinose transferase-like glycosyltransferase